MLLAWIVITVVGLLLLTQAAGWNGSTTIAILHALTPYALLTAVPLAAFAMWQRLRALAVVAAACGLGALVLSAPLVFPRHGLEADPGAEGISVATINLYYRNPVVSEVADEMEALDPDVIVFSEYTPELRASLLNNSLSSRYPYKAERAGELARGIALWSRFPLLDDDQIESSDRIRGVLSGTANPVVDAVVDGPDGPIRVFGVHPPTPISSFDGWTADLDLIAEAASTEDLPTVIVGDFNASYWHPPFRDLLDAGFVDAHIAGGQGLSVSWPTDEFFPPFVRLDHALTGNGLSARQVVDFDVPGSDHRGFVVSVAPTR